MGRRRHQSPGNVPGFRLLRRFAAIAHVRFWPIVLQKSNVAAPRIFRENKMRETITDSYTLNRAAEVAGEFNARGSLPSRLYTKIAPAARRIFEHQCKTTFATLSARNGRSTYAPWRQLTGQDRSRQPVAGAAEDDPISDTSSRLFAVGQQSGSFDGDKGSLSVA